RIRPRLTDEFRWTPGKTGQVQAQARSGGKAARPPLGKQIKQGVFTGISYMIPAVVAGGTMMGVSGLIAVSNGIDNINDPSIWAHHPNLFWVVVHYFNTTGSLLFDVMFPFFAGFTAFGLANRQGLVPGFLGGLLSTKLGAGFFGALIIGLFVGFFVRWLDEKIKISETYISIKTVLLVPVIASAVVVVLMMFVIGPVFGQLNISLREWLAGTGQAGPLMYAALIAGAMAFDLGGPVNKAALTIALAFALDKVLPLTSCMIGIVMPPIGIGVATMIDKWVVRKQVYGDNFRQLGKTALVLGMLGISEGAIPFALADPLFVVPVNVIGSILAAGVAEVLGAQMWLPLAAVWAWPFVTNAWAYVIGILAGTAFIALLNIYYRNYRINRGTLSLDEEQ
ncbi:MAG: PTS fructose transporter subunit IIC, partial [Negativicutes bacterium]|nr:PTS fructose transporter subunit IIC [Negativicutes bacterium]